MADYETLPVECPECDSHVRADLPPVDVLVSCDECGHRFWVRPIDPFDDPSDEIPPGMLAIACLNGGGTATVAGSMQGNATIATAKQAQAAARQHGAAAVTDQLAKQNNVQVNGQDVGQASNLSLCLDRNEEFRAHEQALRRKNHR